MLELLSFYPLLFLIVGVTVLFLRLEDPYAWGLAVYTRYLWLLSSP